MTGRRAVGLGGCLAAIVLVLVLLALDGSGAPSSVPEGGSSFGAGPAAPRHPGTTLPDALAPVLEPEGTTATPAATAAATSGSAPATPALPAAPPRAAARLFLVGFGGPAPSRAVLRRLASHEWGGVVLEAGNGVSVPQVAQLVQRVRRAVRAAHHAAPMVVASQPGADGDALPVGTPLPSRIPDAAAARRVAQATAKALKPLGVQMVLGPEADTGTAGGPWAGRAYSDDPATVGALAGAAVAGFKDVGVAP